jgi:predicted Zn-dependent protease
MVANQFCSEIEEIEDFPYFPTPKLSYEETEFRGLIFLGESQICQYRTAISALFGLANQDRCARSEAVYQTVWPDYASKTSLVEWAPEAYQEILRERTVNAALGRRAGSIGNRMAAVGPHAEWDWEFAVFESDERDAFALPGGKVGVHSALLETAGSDAQLAAAIGHVMAHAVLGHRYGSIVDRPVPGYQSEQYEKKLQREQEQIGELVDIFMSTLGRGPRKRGPEVASLYGAATHGMIYSARQEAEADFLNLIYMARAGYDPSEAIALWRTLKSLGGSESLASGHGGAATRLKSLTGLLPSAAAIYEAQRSG